MNAELATKQSRLKAHLRSLESVIVAYSGGVDSSLLAYYARTELKENALVVIAISPSLAADELSAAREQASQFNFDLLEIHTKEVESSEYQRNDEMRCYFCKQVLFAELEALAAQRGFKHIAYGANMDDKKDFRPGHKAAREFDVVSPLQDAGLSKEEIRQLAQAAGLPSWDRPQAACLSSRFPTFEPVTIEGLTRVDRAESYIRSLGFSQVRVRHQGQTASVEVDAAELPALKFNAALQAKVREQLTKLGFTTIDIDPHGYRQGNANTFLTPQSRPINPHQV